MDNVDKYAKTLWDYHHLNHEVKKADILMCFTSLDLSVAKYCAKLFHKNYAPLVLISGGNATNKWIPDEENLQRTNWGTDSEAEKYYEVVLENGVPKESNQFYSKLNLQTQARTLLSHMKFLKRKI